MNLAFSKDVLKDKGTIAFNVNDVFNSRKRIQDLRLPTVNSYEKGDLLVNINVWIPQKLTKDETKILEKLNESENFKPNPSGKEKSFFDRMKEYFHD